MVVSWSSLGLVAAGGPEAFVPRLAVSWSFLGLVAAGGPGALVPPDNNVSVGGWCDLLGMVCAGVLVIPMFGRCGLVFCSSSVLVSVSVRSASRSAGFCSSFPPYHSRMCVSSVWSVDNSRLLSQAIPSGRLCVSLCSCMLGDICADVFKIVVRGSLLFPWGNDWPAGLGTGLGPLS